MKRKTRYDRILSNADLFRLHKQVNSFKETYIKHHKKRRQILLDFFREEGLDKFCNFVLALLDPGPEYEFSPAPHNYPELGEKLKTTHTRGLKVSRVSDHVLGKKTCEWNSLYMRIQRNISMP